MIATARIWRWLGKVIEVTEPGQRCDWVTPSSPYFQLGMTRQS